MRPADATYRPHEIRAQERSKERDTESKQMQRLQELLRKKLTQSGKLAFNNTPAKVA
jgi:type II secretory pathway component PulJ